MKRKRAVFEIDNPRLDNYHILLNETLFHNANGYIGVRYDFEEGYPEGCEPIRSQYINGFYDFLEVKQAERLYGLVDQKQVMLDIANTQTIRLIFEDEEFSMFTGTLLHSRLTLDMDRGVTVRDVIWRSPKGREMHITVTRMASFHQLSLFTIEYTIEPLNFSEEIVIESSHDVRVENFYDPADPATADERIKPITPLSCEIKNGASYITAAAAESGLRVCSCVKNVLSQDGERQFLVKQRYRCLQHCHAGQAGRANPTHEICRFLRLHTPSGLQNPGRQRDAKSPYGADTEPVPKTGSLSGRLLAVLLRGN
jgi:alpha,alpha-trehalose phosphorylase